MITPASSCCRVLLLSALLIGGGCATYDAQIALEDRLVQNPNDPNIFALSSAGQSVVGEPQVVFTHASDTLSDLARTYGLGYDEIVAANPDVDPWLPGANTPVLLPTQYVLPDAPQRGVILNIATKRLFYFPEPVTGEPQLVLTFPIGIGRVGWETPLGDTTVVSKATDPHWWVPASVRREHAEMGDPLPTIVPPGPDNPLGTHVLKLAMPGYLIHGTNQPYGVGMRVSHGCVRLYPENIEVLYSLVDIGEPVTILNEPYQIGRQDGALFFEAHLPLEDDVMSAEERLVLLLDSQVDVGGQPLNEHLREHVISLARDPNGVAVSVALYDASEVLRRVRVVHNIVEPDPNEPTLSEVREMIDSLMDETL